MDLDAVLARRPQVAIVDEIAHTNIPGSPQPQALPGRAGAARRRHQRHRRLQRPAPREPERPRRAGHRRDGARDRPRHLPQAGRPGREPRPRRRGPARAAAGRQDLRRREGPLGAGALLPARKPRHAARAGAARGGGEPGARPRAGPPTRSAAAPSAAARPGDGLHVLLLAPRADAAAPRLAHGRAAQHRLVRGLRRDARRGARPHRRRGPAPPASRTSSWPASWAPRWCGSRRAIRCAAILDFARSHGVGHIIVGRSHQPWWRRLLGARSSCSGWSTRPTGFDVHIVSFEEEEARHDAPRPSCSLAQVPLGARPGRASASSRCARSRTLGAQLRARSSPTTTAACSPPSA